MRAQHRLTSQQLGAVVLHSYQRVGCDARRAVGPSRSCCFYCFSVRWHSSWEWNSLLLRRRSDTTDPSASASPPMISSSPAAMGSHHTGDADDSLASVFWSAPLPERLAALTVSNYSAPTATTSPSATAAAAAAAGGGVQPVPGAMPMKTFIEAMSSATRDAILQARIDVPTWVQRTQLLEVVYQKAYDGVVSTEADSASSNSNNSNNNNTVPTFGSLRFVRVRTGSPEDILKISRCDSACGGASRGDPCGLEEVPPPKHDNQEEEEEEKKVTGDHDHHGALGTSASLSSSYVVDVPYLLKSLETVLLHKQKESQLRYSFIQHAFQMVMREAARHADGQQLAQGLRLAIFEQALAASPLLQQHVWILQDRYVAWRLPGETSPPPFVSPQPRVTTATLENNYGGWGSASAVPTREDVYEVLKYIPVHWGNLGSISISAATKKKHMRANSTLQWFRRQPFYFELRNMNGTTEIRRSVVLHPEAHGLSAVEAHEMLQLSLASGDANSLTPLGPDGQPLPSEMSGTEKITRKFFLRVCPPYFAPVSLSLQRYTKKNLTDEHLVEMARRYPEEFEVYHPRFSDIPLVRKRVGADSARWREDFVGDVERHPEDVRHLVALMNRLCPTWDRPQYVYVRLSPAEQRAMGGYDAMMAIMKRHPAVFRLGEHFVSRVDSSDPFAQREAEPSVKDLTSRTHLREENPYLSPLDLALVFHYAAPADTPFTASFLVDCSSPAMRVALPPRVISIVQQFPRLFACKESSPGVFSIHKIVKQRGDIRSIGGGEQQHAAATVEGSGCGGPADADVDDSWMLGEEMAAEEHISRDDTVLSVKELIPEAGVEGTQLLLWASMNVQRAANHYFGGILKMVEAEKKHFRVVDNQHQKMIYRRE